MAEINFVKYHGAGNDFVIIDERQGNLAQLLDTKAVAFICHRHFGIGADGLMRLQESSSADFYMKYYNADGNESSLCGNGSRCIVAFAKRLGIIQDYANFETSDGAHEAWIAPDGEVKLRMHIPHGHNSIDNANHFIDTGSPHHVRFVEESNINDLDVVNEGTSLRYSDRYAPGGANINFVNVDVDAPLSLNVRTYERGVENETLSCGTGVTACAYVHLLKNQLADGKVEIRTPGGNLAVDIRGRGTTKEEVFLIGPAQFVFAGTVTV